MSLLNHARGFSWTRQAACVLALPSLLLAQEEPTPLLDQIKPSPLEVQILEGVVSELGSAPGESIILRESRFSILPGQGFNRWEIGGGPSLSLAASSRRVNLEDLYVRALRYSSQIRVFSDLPLIRETGIQEAKGAFDTNTFLKGQFERTNEPVGSILQTGDASRFRQDEWSLEAGLRKKTITGAEIGLTQRLSRTDNNSIYFVPNPQAKAQLELTIVQPLLKGAGTAYNRSIIEIARLDSEVAMNEFIRQAESHLLEITRTYWALQAARENLASKQRLVGETEKTTDELKARETIDAQRKQVFRAESALASRRADLIRASAAVKNAQDRLKTLINDPEYLSEPNLELIPVDPLSAHEQSVNTQNAAKVALEYRPEIRQAFMQLRAATIRERVSKNELMPELNLVLSGAVNGLDGAAFGEAFGNQYTTGSPSWGAGVVFSFPLENNIARAQHTRRQIETRQQMDQVRTTIDSVMLEVKISAREVSTSWKELQAKQAAARAFREDILTLQARRAVEVSGTAVRSDESLRTSAYLDGILDAQDRLAFAEEEATLAGANYQVAVVNLQRAKGRLLSYHDVDVVRSEDERGLPVLHLEKGARSGKELLDAKAAR